MAEDEPPDGIIMRRKNAIAGTVILCLLSATGGGLIIWWAIAFHRSNDQLWMVPFGLVLTGTPIIAWVSVLASDSCRRSQLLLASANVNADRAPVDGRSVLVIGDES